MRSRWVVQSGILLELDVTSYMKATRVAGAIGGVILAQRGSSAQDTVRVEARDSPVSPS